MMCDRDLPDIVIDPGTPERRGRDGVWCDPCIEPIVRALNEGGLRTVASCCGHGERPGRITLSDDTDLYVHRGEARP